MHEDVSNVVLAAEDYMQRVMYASRSFGVSPGAEWVECHARRTICPQSWLIPVSTPLNLYMSSTMPNFDGTRDPHKSNRLTCADSRLCLLKMPTQKRREITSRIFQPFKDIVRTPDRGVQSALLSPDPTPLKRKALTSEPSSPTSTRRPRKRPNLALPLRLTPRRIFKFKPAVPVQLPSPPAPPSPSPLAPADTGTALDAEPEYDSDSASHQSSCETSPSTDTLAPDQSSARASARAHGIDTRVGKDRAAANRVLKLIKEFKSEKYKVEEGGSRGKYLVERKLHLAGYKLLLEKLEEDTLEQQRLESKDRDEESLEQYVKHRLQ